MLKIRVGQCWATGQEGEFVRGNKAKTESGVPQFTASQWVGVAVPVGTPNAVIEKANSINDVPVVVDFVVHKDAMVWPMVAAGTSNDDIKVARDMAPVWDQEDL